MKTLIALAFSLTLLVPVKAQVLRSETVNGAVLGGVAGAIIGNNSGDLHHNAWRGAAIGSLAGAMIGSAVADSHDYSRRTQVHVSAGYSGYGYGYGYRPYGYSHSYGHRSYYRPSYASRGLLLGGITGAIIGNNSYRHNAWRGAAWGAGAGLLLGAIADDNARYREERLVVVPATADTAPAPAQTPQNVTIINNYYGSSSPMGTANSMFGR